MNIRDHFKRCIFMQIVGRISYFRDRAWINVIFIKKNGSPLVPFKKKKHYRFKRMMKPVKYIIEL